MTDFEADVLDFHFIIKQRPKISRLGSPYLLIFISKYASDWQNPTQNQQISHTKKTQEKIIYFQIGVDNLWDKE